MGSRECFLVHLPKGSNELHFSHSPPIPPKKTGTTGTACKSLILKVKSCSVARTITKSPEQKSPVLLCGASFKQTVNDATQFRLP
jgi:hypothetical protein